MRIRLRVVLKACRQAGRWKLHTLYRLLWLNFSDTTDESARRVRGATLWRALQSSPCIVVIRPGHGDRGLESALVGVCVSSPPPHLMRKREIDGGRWRRGEEEREKKRLTAPEDDSSETQLGSYSGSCLIQNNTITRNHSLNCYLGDWKRSWWKTIKEDQNKGSGRAVAHGLLIEDKKEGPGENMHKAREKKERGWSNWAKQTHTHIHTNPETTWRYIKLEAISSKPVAWGHAEQNRASFH